MTFDVECPRPVRSLKRALQDTLSDCAPVSKHCQFQSSTFLPSLTLIYDWLSEVPHPSSPPSNHPSSAPARLLSSETFAVIGEHICPPMSLAIIKQMLQSRQAKSLVPGSVTSAQSSRPVTSSLIYRSTLINNNIYMDLRGRKIPANIRALVDTHILKK